MTEDERLEEIKQVVMEVNPDLMTCLEAISFLLDFAHYKVELKGHISSEAIKQTKEYMQFKKMMKGVSRDLGGVEEGNSKKN